MKQKYMITVADMELSIVSDASPEEVENIVGILDRRMRDIKLKSPNCTKNEAAILCALAYCSERIGLQESYKKMEGEAFRYAAENERLKKTIEQLRAEADSLRGDISVLRSLLDRAMAENTGSTGASVDVSIPTPPPASEGEQISVFSEETPEAPASEEPKAKGGKNRVGSMFDLLNFDDKI